MRSIRLGLTASAVAFVVVALAAAPALADTEAGHTGLTGTHSLRDTADKPGATCTYKPKGVTDVPFSLASVRVRPPIVFARDVTGGVDQQRTGWRFSLERKLFSESTWTEVFRSATQKAQASDASAAAFSAMSGKPPLPTQLAAYRVVVKMFWYRNGATEGTATHIVDFYFWKIPTGSQTVGPIGDCPDGAGN